MDLIGLLNDQNCLADINELIAPFKYDSEKGSHIIASAVHAWSKNNLAPVLWADSNGKPAFWGTQLLCRDSTQPQSDESKIFFVPVYSAVDNRAFKNPKVRDLAGWPNYSNKGYSSTRYEDAISSPTWNKLSPNQNKKVPRLIEYIQASLGDFNLITDKLIKSAMEVARAEYDNQRNYGRSSNPSDFEIVRPVSVQGVPHTHSRKAWNIGGAPEISYSKWPIGLTADELVSYLKNSSTAPENPRLASLNIMLYLRANKLSLTADHLNDLASIFKTCDYLQQPTGSLKGINYWPDQAKVLWLESLIESRRKLSPAVLDFIDEFKHPTFEKYIPKPGSVVTNPMLSPEGEIYAAIRIVRDYKNTTNAPELSAFKTETALLYIGRNLKELYKRFDWLKCSSEQLKYFYSSDINTVTRLKAMTISELVHNITPDDWSDQPSEQIDSALTALQTLILHSTPTDKAGYLMNDLVYYLDKLEENINKYYDRKTNNGEYVDLKDYKNVVFDIVKPRNVDMTTLLSLHDNKWLACTTAWQLNYNNKNDQAQPLPHLDFD